MEIKYLILIMFGHAKAQDVVTELLQGIREISHSSQAHVFSWNGWAKCEQVYTEQIMPDRKEERLSVSSRLHTKLSDS